MSFEKIKSGAESTDHQIKAEGLRLQRNAGRLRDDLSQRSPEKEGKESVDRLASSATKLIIGASALVAIPVVASMVSPEVSQQIAEWSAASKEFIVENVWTVLAVIGSGMGYVLISDYLESRKRKD